MMLTPTQSIPVAYHSLLGAFDEQVCLALLRQWFKQPPQWQHISYVVPRQYQRHVQECRWVARYLDADDEPVDVVVVVAQQPYTWQAKHHILHAVAVRALRSWAVLPDFRSVVVFVTPDRSQWRMQYIEQEIESYRDYLGTIKARQRVTLGSHYRLDMVIECWKLIPFAYWHTLQELPRAVTIHELKEAYMSVPAHPAEAFQRAHEQGIAAIEAYVQQLQASMSALSFAERAKINEQLATLHQLADQWERASRPMAQFLAGNSGAVHRSNPSPHQGTALRLDDNWAHRKPVTVQHGEQTYKVRSWSELYTVILHNLYKARGLDFIELINNQYHTSGQNFFSRVDDDFIRSTQIDGWYFDTNLSAGQIAMRIKRIYQMLQIPLDSFVVWVQPE